MDKRICVHCGGEIAATRQGNAVYCSKKCCRAEKSKREKERRGVATPKKLAVNFGKPRTCHDCGKPTANYRCPECWKKLRAGMGITESELDAAV